MDSLEKELEGLKDDMGDLKKVHCIPPNKHWIYFTLQTADLESSFMLSASG